MLKLYHNDMSSCAQKVRFALFEKGLDWEGEELDLRAGDQLRPEFLAINPKGLVPALVHDGNVLVESNVILEYLEEAFPTPPLMPADPLLRASARWRMKKLDDGIHLEVIALSFGIAFRHQLIAACGNDAALEAHFNAIPDPYVREIQREVVRDGVHSARFAQAIAAFDAWIHDLNETLASQAWIAGDVLSLADIAYAPYATRLDHLQLQSLWQGRRHFEDWYARIRKVGGYEEGIARWINPKYQTLMANAGQEAGPEVATVLRTTRNTNNEERQA